MLIAGNQARVRQPGKSEISLAVDPAGTSKEFRFLNSDLIGCLDHRTSDLLVFDVNGREKNRYKVAKSWRTGILPAASGSRFAIYEDGYTAVDAIINFLDIDDARPQNFQRVRLVDLPSGKEIYSLEWDPRPYLVRPAISPNGHRIARVRAGTLEVFDVN